MVDPVLLNSAMRGQAGMLVKYHGMEDEGLYQFVMSLLPVEEPLKTEINRTLWNIIFYLDENGLDCRDRAGEGDHPKVCERGARGLSWEEKL